MGKYWPKWNESTLFEKIVAILTVALFAGVIVTCFFNFTGITGISEKTTSVTIDLMLAALLWLQAPVVAKKNKTSAIIYAALGILIFVIGVKKFF